MLHHPFVDPDELKVVDSTQFDRQEFHSYPPDFYYYPIDPGAENDDTDVEEGVIWKGTEKEAHLDGNVDN